MGLKLSKILPGTAELIALGHLEKSPYYFYGRNVVTTLVLSFLTIIVHTFLACLSRNLQGSLSDGTQTGVCSCVHTFIHEYL